MLQNVDPIFLTQAVNKPQINISSYLQITQYSFIKATSESALSILIAKRSQNLNTQIYNP